MHQFTDVLRISQCVVSPWPTIMLHAKIAFGVHLTAAIEYAGLEREGGPSFVVMSCSCLVSGLSPTRVDCHKPPTASSL